MNEQAPTTAKLIAIYARVSTARQEEDGTIETQLTVLRDFACQQNYIIASEYVDDGWSGDVLVRPSLDALCVPTISIMHDWSPGERWEQAQSGVRFVHPMANAS
jgi:hypothetical protein